MNPDAWARQFERAFLGGLAATERVFAAEIERELRRWLRSAAVDDVGESRLRMAAVARIGQAVDAGFKLTSRGLVAIETKSGEEAARAERVRWAQTQGAKLAKRLTEQQRAEIARIVEEATQAGKNPRSILNAIASVAGADVNAAGVPISARLRAARIARTELHNAATWGSLQAARVERGKGRDVVKVWRSTIDGRTRETHSKANGQVREIEEPFVVGGASMLRPGDGPAREVVNCRCVMLVVPRRSASTFAPKFSPVRPTPARPRPARPSPPNAPTTTPQAPQGPSLARDESVDAVRLPLTVKNMRAIARDAVPPPSLTAQPPGIEGDEIEAARASRRFVLAAGQAHRVEFIACYEWRSGRAVTLKGDRGSAPVPGELFQTSAGRRWIIHHNHPKRPGDRLDYPLSAPDISCAASIARTETIFAHGENGSVYAARWTGDRTSTVIRALDSRNWPSNAPYWRSCERSRLAGLTREEAVVVAAHAVNQAAAELGLIEYRFVLNAETRAVLKAHRAEVLAAKREQVAYLKARGVTKKTKSAVELPTMQRDEGAPIDAIVVDPETYLDGLTPREIDELIAALEAIDERTREQDLVLTTARFWRG